MRKVFSFSITLVFILLGCKNNTVKENSNSKYQSSDIDEIESKSTKSITISLLNNSISNEKLKSSKFIKENDFVKEDENKIVIISNSGKNILFENKKDTSDETASISYTYIGMEKNSGLHWITAQNYEEEKHYLIDRLNAEKMEIWNKPEISPNGNLIFSIQNPCFRIFEDCPTGFQIWKFEDGNFSKLNQIDLKNYYLVDGKWKSNHELIIIVSPTNLDSNQKLLKYSIQINNSN